MRALFLNEGAVGAEMLGHGAMADALSQRMGGVADVHARFCSMEPLSGLAYRLALGLPPLSRWDLDLQMLRWHAVQAARARRLLLRELKREAVDVLHVHSHSIAMGLLDVMRRVPTVVSVDATVREWRELEIWHPMTLAGRLSMRPSLAVERRVFGAAHTVLAWSAWAEDGVRASCPGARVVRHDPGFDLERFHPAAEREPRERPRVLFVGGRFAEKGGEDLLAALDPLLGRAVDLDLVTTSGVVDRPGVRVHRLKPDDPRLVELHQQADVFALPTYGDSSPWALREAMACGAAAVGSRVGAIEELLDDGRAGVLVERGDRPALREAIEGLLADESRRRALGAAARARCEAMWDGRRQTAELVELLAAAAGGSSG